MIDISYPESYLRTSLPVLPSRAPKWLLEFWQSPERDYVIECDGADDVDDADVVRESIEPRDEDDGAMKGRDVWGDGKREWNGYASVNGSGKLKRRYDYTSTDGDADISSTHPSRKVKRSKH